MYGKKWTSTEQERLTDLTKDNLSDSQIGQILGRSALAIKMRREKMSSELSKIYILCCSHGKYYVGKTQRNVNDRVLEHFNKYGSAWTKMHPPINIIKSFESTCEFDEDTYTKKYMMMYGIDNVRGGCYVLPALPLHQVLTLKDEFNSAEDRCFKCGEKGHFAKNCQS